MKPLLELIAALRALDPNIPENAPVFEALLADVVALRTPEAILPLLGLFNDQSLHDEVMFSIIHGIEVFDDKKYVEQILRGTVDFCAQSPRWASIVFIRMLNSEAVRSELVHQLRDASADTKVTIKGLMETINMRGVQFSPKTTAVIVAAS